MLTPMKSIVAVLMVACLSFGTVGCSNQTSTLITSLNAVAEASSVAVVVVAGLQAAGKVSDADAALVTTLSVQVGTASNKSIAELNSADSNPQKITVISALFANIVIPQFNTGLSAATVNGIVQAVAGAIQVFLGQLHGNAVLTAAHAYPTEPIKLSRGDKNTIKAIQKKIAETNAAAVQVRK